MPFAPFLIDAKGICARSPDAVDEFIDVPVYDDWLAALRDFHGSNGRGLRRMGRIVPSLKLVGNSANAMSLRRTA
eukprot:3409978-Lingulodinium_polyedra.AAC.1